MDTFPEKKKRHQAGLQLAPLIDIFVLIIVFLIKGTIMGGVNVEIPTGLMTAFSKSPEDLEAAPAVYIYPDRLELKFLEKSFLLNKFDQDNEPTEFAVIRSEIKTFYDKLPVEARRSGNLVNLVADARVNYDRVFQVVKFLRQSGIASVLFIAEGEQKL